MKQLIKLSITILLIATGAMNAWTDETTTTSGPKEVVESTINGIIEVLEGRENKDLLTEKDRTAIRTIVNGKFDYREMSRRSLGKKWAKKWKVINTAKQNELTAAFRDLLERSYGNR
ncbi:MAG: ABC transporter substrate-binding protein, partial [Mariprofundaceae bacterium]